MAKIRRQHEKESKEDNEKEHRDQEKEHKSSDSSKVESKSNDSSQNWGSSKDTQTWGSKETQNLQYNEQENNNSNQYPTYQAQNTVPSNEIGANNIENIGNANASENQVEHVKVESIGDDNRMFFEINESNRGTIILIIFLGVLGVYLIISLLIYVASFFIKSKNDEIAEEFLNQVNKQNQFYLDPKFNKSPMVKEREIEDKYKKTENKDENEDIWENFIVTGKNNNVGINIKKNEEYPITTPVSPVMSKTASPLQKSYPNENYIIPGSRENGINLTNEPTNYVSRESNSTSSSTSITNLIPKHQQIMNDMYNHEDVRQLHQHQYPNGRSQIKFNLNKNGSPNPNVYTTKAQISQGYSSPARPQFIELQGSQGSQLMNSPVLELPMANIPAKPTPILKSHSPNPRSPIVEYQGSQGSYHGSYQGSTQGSYQSSYQGSYVRPLNSRPQPASQINPNLQVNYNPHNYNPNQVNQNIPVSYGQNALNQNAINYNTRY